MNEATLKLDEAKKEIAGEAKPPLDFTGI
jgi:hypothetical protein